MKKTYNQWHTYNHSIRDVDIYLYLQGIYIKRQNKANLSTQKDSQCQYHSFNPADNIQAWVQSMMLTLFTAAMIEKDGLTGFPPSIEPIKDSAVLLKSHCHIKWSLIVKIFFFKCVPVPTHSLTPQYGSNGKGLF